MHVVYERVTMPDVFWRVGILNAEALGGVGLVKVLERLTGRTVLQQQTKKGPWEGVGGELRMEAEKQRVKGAQGGGPWAKEDGE